MLHVNLSNMKKEMSTLKLQRERLSTLAIRGLATGYKESKQVGITVMSETHSREIQ